MVQEETEKVKPVKFFFWELGKDLFGKYSSGKGNLSKERKKLLKKKLIEKYNEKVTD